jgi:hypothetical protein
VDSAAAWAAGSAAAAPAGVGSTWTAAAALLRIEGKFGGIKE